MAVAALGFSFFFCVGFRDLGKRVQVALGQNLYILKMDDLPHLHILKITAFLITEPGTFQIRRRVSMNPKV